MTGVQEEKSVKILEEYETFKKLGFKQMAKFNYLVSRQKLDGFSREFLLESSAVRIFVRGLGKTQSPTITIRNNLDGPPTQLISTSWLSDVWVADITFGQLTMHMTKMKKETKFIPIIVVTAQGTAKTDVEGALSDLKRLWTEKKLIDFHLVCEGTEKRVGGHAAVLAAASRVIERRLGDDWKGESLNMTVPIKKRSTLKCLVEFCYSRRLQAEEMDLYDMIDLASAADFLEIEGLSISSETEILRMCRSDGIDFSEIAYVYGATHGTMLFGGRVETATFEVLCARASEVMEDDEAWNAAKGVSGLLRRLLSSLAPKRRQTM
jgi:hypothetical protein